MKHPVSAFALALVLGTTLLAACGGDDTPVGNVPETADAGTSPGASGSARLWYFSADAKQIGITDSTGADLWSEELGTSAQDMTIGGGSIWLAMGDGSVRRYDQTTHTLTATIPAVTKIPATALVYAGGAVWVADYDASLLCGDQPTGLARIDAATNTVVAHVKVQQKDTESNCDKIVSLQTDGTRLFGLIENFFTLVGLDVTTGAVTKRTPLGTGGGYGTGALAIGSETLWVHNTNAKTIIAVDPATLVVESSTPIADDYQADEIAATKNQIVVKHSDTSILRIDALDPTKQVAVQDLDVDILFASANRTFATISPGLEPALLTLDETTAMESARLVLPTFSKVDRVLFLP